jgi:hypothetical protein
METATNRIAASGLMSSRPSRTSPSGPMCHPHCHQTRSLPSNRSCHCLSRQTRHSDVSMSSRPFCPVPRSFCLWLGISWHIGDVPAANLSTDSNALLLPFDFGQATASRRRPVGAIKSVFFHQTAPIELGPEFKGAAAAILRYDKVGHFARNFKTCQFARLGSRDWSCLP